MNREPPRAVHCARSAESARAMRSLSESYGDTDSDMSRAEFGRGKRCGDPETWICRGAPSSRMCIPMAASRTTLVAACLRRLVGQ
jgi:hypothetical protein